jgi:hypothetical protein
MPKADLQPNMFNLTTYISLVTELTAQGYLLRDFSSAKPRAQDLILRHDVDFDLGCAVEMASAEADAGLQATYFILLRTEFYNPFGPEGRSAIEGIVSHGHRIGLHFDAALYDDDAETLGERVLDEARRLGDLASQELRCFSFHRPQGRILNQDMKVAGLINAYGGRYFREMGYCSDSRGAWHHGHPLCHDAVLEQRALQLLTHPIWWTSRPGETPRQRLDRLVMDRSSRLRHHLKEHCGVYKDEDEGF